MMPLMGAPEPAESSGHTKENARVPAVIISYTLQDA